MLRGTEVPLRESAAFTEAKHHLEQTIYLPTPAHSACFYLLVKLQYLYHRHFYSTYYLWDYLASL